MKKTSTWNRIGSLLLMLAMVLTMSVTALPVYAAGTGTISVKYDPGIEGLASTSFKLYKAGKYDRSADGKSVVVLEDQFAASKVTFPNDASPEDERWQEAWFDTARSLGNWAKNHESSLTTAWEGTLTAADAFRDLGEYPNGVYLLVGKEQLVGEEFWTPVPVLIQVLNGRSEFAIDNLEVKMASRPLVHRHTVSKSWQDDGYIDGRPGSVKVAVYCGDTRMDTVEFNNENGYIYTWYSYLDKQTGKWIYTSKNPADESAEGFETEKLNEANSFRIAFDGGDATWGAEEIMPERYAAGENMYMANVPDGELITDDAEKFDIVNTVILPVDHDPPVIKKIKGDKPKRNEGFEFTLEGISKPANVDEIPMPDGAEGNTKTIRIKADELTEFGDIVFKVPGEYVYEIREVDTGKKGYKYDDSVFTLVYNMTVEESEPGVYQLVMDRKVYKDGAEYKHAEYTFVNEYTAPATPGNSPFTGDNTKILIPVVMFAAAFTALLAMIIKKRKNKDDDQ
jgi:hypothetical protein